MSPLELHAINTVTTNVPGPQFPLYVLGHQMIEAYPFVPIFGSVRISIAIFSCLGGLNFGVTADYDSAPDIEVLCDGIEAGVAEYLEIAAESSLKGHSNGTGTPPTARDGGYPRGGTPRRKKKALRATGA